MTKDMAYKELRGKLFELIREEEEMGGNEKWLALLVRMLYLAAVLHGEFDAALGVQPDPAIQQVPELKALKEEIVRQYE